VEIWDLAVDIGVSTVVAAVRDETGVQLVTFDGTPVLPALVRCSGGPAQAGVSLADDQLTAAPGTILLSPKRLMISPAVTDASDFPAAASELYAAILLTVAEAAADGREEAVPDRLILTHPAAWTDDHLDVLRDAAEAAELPAPEFIAEPFAAAWRLGARTVAGQLLAILDIGEGSVDMALLRRTRAGFKLIGPPGSVARTGDDPLDVSARQGIYKLLATIRAAGLTSEDLAEVYVTGGASREVEVEELITEILGIATRLDRSPLMAVAWGALVAAAGTSEPPAGQVADDFAERRPGRATVIRAAITVVAIALVAAAGAVIEHHRLADRQPAKDPIAKQLVTSADRRTPSVIPPSSRNSPTPTPSDPRPAPSSAAPAPSQTPVEVPSQTPTQTASPAEVVQDYFGAINEHDYQTAWRLGGYHFASSYSAFEAGFETTVRDVLRIIAVDGNDVTIKLTAVQTNGTSVAFEGIYAISGGTIASASMRRVS
jgi:hypothetical protein